VFVQVNWRRWTTHFNVALAFLASVIFVGLMFSENTMADEGQIELNVTDLERADEIILMKIPTGIDLLRGVDIEDLPSRACTYRLRQDLEPVRRAAISILKDGILETTDRPDHVDLRTGIVFKSEGASIAEFYFGEVAERDVRGIANRRHVRIRGRSLALLRRLPAEFPGAWIGSHTTAACDNY
jgi:hypothetical protein